MPQACWNAPGAQGMQAVAPGTDENIPGRQAAHDSDVSAPDSVEAVPLGHGWQASPSRKLPGLHRAGMSRKSTSPSTAPASNRQSTRLYP